MEEINFLARWLMSHLQLHSYPATRSLARAIIDSSNDISIREETNVLNQTAKAAAARREELARASVVLLEHAVSNIIEKFSPRTIVGDLHLPPQGLLRLWGPRSHTKYDERLGFRCSSWTACKPASNLEELKQFLCQEFEVSLPETTTRI